ncbi:hypothetical protein MIND_01409900 [Mycena indigotica]|uniref:Uncharacterized protein n=1 Tax=Mycena indigotica TaxID=2126181 RepID=A0A8H6RW88_9AGAR|nr:uncharacterized protein MIND_01409900 [Mycena indigotica]KAF7288935.1 hypothetical protein MIND_01409900 [Mycena indigotica]
MNAFNYDSGDLHMDSPYDSWSTTLLLSRPDDSSSMSSPNQSSQSTSPSSLSSSSSPSRIVTTYHPPLTGPAPQLPYTAAPPIGSRPRYSAGTPYPDLSLCSPTDPLVSATTGTTAATSTNGVTDRDPRTPASAESSVSLSQLLHESVYAVPNGRESPIGW